MSDESNNEGKLDDTQAAALIASSAIIFSFVVYWALQLESVRELLEFANAVY